LIELHAGLDPLPERDWSAYVLTELDARKEQLRRSAPGTGGLVDHYEQLLAQVTPVELPGGDLVHGDFNSCNVLVHQGQVSGAIDIEALGSGTRAIDYAWLLREAYAEGAHDDVIRLIRRAGEAVAGPRALAFCAPFTAMEWLLWMVHHVPHDVPALLDGLHRLAHDLAQPWTNVR
jgi:Ser/Thr protein kinase RdoA (MazF antagonist)